MKNKLSVFFRKIYHFKDKIAFFPSIIGALGAILAYIIMACEDLGISSYLIEFLPHLVINNAETARTILSTFIAGLISIMVFSFSMVMILLNQASNNFSPRLLPGLISNRRHQIILGIYLANILYCIIILIFIDATENEYRIPGFSVLVAIIFMIFSLSSFIYFIHSISQEIQIRNIMKRIFSSAEKNLIEHIESEKNKDFDFPETKNWNEHKSKISGYIQNVATKNLSKIASEHDCKIEVVAAKGSFINKDQILFKTAQKLNDEKIQTIFDNIEFSRNEFVEDNYLLGFKQLKEIALKSMSPGINDPGTALNAIDYLSELFLLRIQKKDKNITYDNDKPMVLLDSINFETLLYEIMLPLRIYCKHDAVLVKKLFDMLENMKTKCTNKTFIKSIVQEMETLQEDAENTIENKRDLKILFDN